MRRSKFTAGESWCQGAHRVLHHAEAGNICPHGGWTAVIVMSALKDSSQCNPEDPAGQNFLRLEIKLQGAAIDRQLPGQGSRPGDEAVFTAVVGSDVEGLSVRRQGQCAESVHAQAQEWAATESVAGVCREDDKDPAAGRHAGHLQVEVALALAREVIGDSAEIGDELMACVVEADGFVRL